MKNYMVTLRLKEKEVVIRVEARSIEDARTIALTKFKDYPGGNEKPSEIRTERR